MHGLEASPAHSRSGCWKPTERCIYQTVSRTRCTVYPYEGSFRFHVVSTRRTSSRDTSVSSKSSGPVAACEPELSGPRALPYNCLTKGRTIRVCKRPSYDPLESRCANEVNSSAYRQTDRDAQSLLYLGTKLVLNPSLRHWQPKQKPVTDGSRRPAREAPAIPNVNLEAQSTL